MSNPNPIQALSDRVKNSSQQSTHPSQIPIPNSSQNTTANPTPTNTTTQPQGKEKETADKTVLDPKGKNTTLTRTGESDPAYHSSVTKATLKNPIVEILDDADSETLKRNNTPTIDRSTNARAKEILLAKAVRAQEEGDDTKADRFFAMYDSILKEAAATKAVEMNNHEPQPLTSPTVNTKKRPSEAEGTTQVRGINFIWANTNSHDDGGFTPYFPKNLLELKGPIPLTIFNKAWQEEALSHHSKNRPKTEESSAEKNLRYHGLAVPDEWLQSFSDWTLNHRCFHETIRDRYNYPVLAEWILLHKANCDRLQKKHGFMVALRYDIRIRNNAFAFRVEKDGVESFSNISQYKPDTADDTHSEASGFFSTTLPGLDTRPV
ncbi:hypothetical protein PGT21_034687 [Puccinia graminis f. sp. tritici]|uniref:Uncharacterized protein n=1 Tax=Puccinia graminis f. sp. tritici TaxID=56615 RepID=A0A5B0RP47_PUCGR|nr:hypothetical protein PGT21_034687 [Puccinia graminis f. sp. tritici]KAA1126394.1 hypothetical protein PGTUg99_030761 [Puccinia graminis f. sp. tritici]